MKWTLPIVACLAFATLAAPDARAGDTGVAAALHTLKREGRKLCMDGHFHSGSSAGMPSKAAAMKDAVGSWAGFTAFEYGTDWANWNKAANKSASCTQAASGWGCDIQARPCK